MSADLRQLTVRRDPSGTLPAEQPERGAAMPIANSIGQTIVDAVGKAVPYGRGIKAEVDVEHRSEDGSHTRARIKIEADGRQEWSGGR